MELLTFLIDFILHVDKHLEAFVTSYGTWVYALLFLVIFVETGAVSYTHLTLPTNREV